MFVDVEYFDENGCLDHNESNILIEDAVHLAQGRKMLITHIYEDY